MTEVLDAIEEIDYEVADLIRGEAQRQREVIRLIASENYTSQAVLDAMGTVFTNKYAEGYAGKRYYHGQEFVDQVEKLAIARGKQLFGAEHVNVQPYSGSPANLATYVALANPGDTILGMGLAAGGHLTHGFHVSVSGIFFKGIGYGVDKQTEQLDFDEIEALALEHRPKIIIAGASAYSRTIDFAKFREIADKVDAYLVADMAHISGLVAGGAHPSPVPYADVVTSTTHKTLRGPRSGLILSKKAHAKAIDKAVFPGCQGGPHVHATAALAIAFKEALQPSFTDYAHQVVKNAKHLAKNLQELGYRIVSGGTDNHLMLIDLTAQEVGGKVVADALNRAGIILNANSIPFDPRKPFDPSGVRIGTAAVTTRGMKEKEMDQIAQWFDCVVKNRDCEQTLQKVRDQVKDFATSFPTFAS